MREIQSSKVLKTICYCIIPILVLMIIVNAFSITYYSTYQEDIDGKTTYFETERFAEDLLSTIYTSTRRLSRNVENQTLQMDGVEEETIEYNLSYVGTYSYEILMIDKDGKAYTNIEKTVQTDTQEELEQYIKNKTYNWVYEDDKIATNIEKMSYDNIAYSYMFEEIKDSGYKIYACVKNEDIGEFQIYNTMYNIVSQTYQSAPSVLVISAFLLVIACIYIIFSIGHKKDEEGIYTDSLDKISFEIVAIISGTLLTFE